MVRVRMSKRQKSHPKHSKSRNARVVKKSVHVQKKPRLTERQKVLRRNAAKAVRVAFKLENQKRVAKEKERENLMVAEAQRTKVDVLLRDVVFSEFISKNVGKRAINIIKMLHEPQTDEKIASDLAVKINEVRRILNVLDSYGVARYDTNKDSKGWLTFKWYLDTEKLGELSITVANTKPENGYKLPEDCNDFFYCGKCYDDQKVIMPFDAAFETQFKCDNCGKQLKQLSKTEAQALFEQEMQQSRAAQQAPA